MAGEKRFDVTIAGELNMDLVLYGLPQALQPEREYLANNLLFTLGSSSAIFAHNLSTLGSRVGFMARISDDVFGEVSLQHLAASGTDVSKIKMEPGNGGTGLTVILPYGSARKILTFPGTTFDLKFDDLDFDYLTSGGHFHMASFFLHRGLAPRMVELFRKIKSAGMSISLDTNDDPEGKWEGSFHKVLPFVDILMMNEREVKAAARSDDLNAAAESFAAIVPLVVIKLGSRGAVAYSGKDKSSVPAIDVNMIDSIGAGDSFDAGFIHRHLKGDDPASCMRYGNLAAAYSLTRPGGTEAFRDAGALDNFFRSNMVIS